MIIVPIWGRKKIMDDDDTGNADLADMLAMDAPERSEKLAAHATVLQSQMEEIAEEVRELIAPQPPVALLGYLLGQTHIALMRSEERRVGKECGGECSCRWSTEH